MIKIYVFNVLVESNRSICWDRVVSETGKTDFIVIARNRVMPIMPGRLSLMLLRAEFHDIYNYKVTVARNFSGLQDMTAKEADCAQPEGISDRQLYCFYGEFERLSVSRDTKN